MLTHLTIKNYALIDHLEMDFSNHLNVITGETGAGKSIMLGAMGLLLGNRADTKVLWNENEKCITEGTFDIAPYALQALFEEENLDYDHRTVIRREISPGGKSRAFVNDTPVTLDIMKKIGVRLMDIHSQHETLDLASRSFQLQVIDTFADNQVEKAEYTKAWTDFVKTKSDYDALLSEANALRQEADFVKFQLEEIAKASLVEGEQDTLESSLKVMEHAEEIKTKFHALLAQLDRSEQSITSQLGEVRSVINSLAGFSVNYQKLAERFESARIELTDIVSELENEEEKIDFDPEKIEEIKNRLSLIYQLQQKHRVSSIEALLILQEELQLKADKTNNLDGALAQLETKLAAATKLLAEKSEHLSQSRKNCFQGFCKQMQSLLAELGIPDAKLNVDHERISPGASGGDKIEFMFGANKGIPVRPLGQVASGGEFSRVMFCIKYILAEKTALPTLILDEIDTGVSGEIAMRLGKMMRAMAKDHQLLAISHLPQIAAKADCHFYAFKNSKSKKTVSQIKLLSDAERIEEIAKMIGGEKPSALAKENAKELIMD